jgi:hypothetical protein
MSLREQIELGMSHLTEGIDYDVVKPDIINIEEGC